MPDDNIQPASHHQDDLYLVKIGEGEDVKYLICQCIITSDPRHGGVGIPYHELERMLAERPLHATSLPGMRVRGSVSRTGQPGASTGPGVSTGPGASTRVEINIDR